MMISNSTLKRKSSASASSWDGNHSIPSNNNNSNPGLLSTKKFRASTYSGNINQNEQRMSLLSNSTKSISSTTTKKLNMINGETMKPYKRFEESECTPVMLAEYRRLQHELQCQEALLVLMQKLKTNQRLVSSTNNNGLKQPATATKLNQQTKLTDGKTTSITATKQQTSSPINNNNRGVPNKTPHPNQYTVNRSNNSSQNLYSSSKSTSSSTQALRQSSSSSSLATPTPTSATRVSSTTPTTATKTSSIPSNTSNASKSNGVAAEQHLLNAKLALRKQLEQTLLQIPTPKPSTCDLTFIPGLNGWSEFLAFLGLEQAFNIYNDIVNRRPPMDTMANMPHVCAQCGTDWSVTWHELTSTNESNTIEEKILCDRCTKTSQKKLLKQDHSTRLRQAFIKALQQEKELDAKFQQQSTTTGSTSSTSSNAPPSTTSNSIKQSPSSQSLNSNKHVHSSSKHSNKPLSTKTSSNHHQHHHHHNNSSNNHNHHSHSHSHSHSHHHHHHNKSNASSSKNHHNNAAALANLTASPVEALASTLAALQTNEQIEFFQKHFLSNMLPFAVANQAAAAALAAKSTQQQQALAAFPAMAASLMRQPNPAQYLLDMIPQAAKQQQQQQQHHHHSK